ncbi:MAG: ATP-binding protein [Oribacterium sp.]|nr:ATP-binding protein [Oribacterium sp.]
MTDRKLPVGIQSFEKVRESNNLYIDKTSFIYKLVHTDVPYFLSRPRRFGKSLLLSTFKAYWEGKKELFKGLEIERLEKDDPDAWQQYPVLYLDFNGDDYTENTALEGILEYNISEWEKRYDISSDHNKSLALRFKSVIREAHSQTGKRCVILVDEYDKPLLECVENIELVERNKALFKGVFSNLKSEDAHIKFIFITGVTKFSKISIFSDLNQLEDISFDFDYSGICGITEEELKQNLIPEIEVTAKERGMTTEDCITRLKAMYDGYRFSADGEGVYNPYSLLSALKKRRFGSFWYETGTPTFLMHRLKEMEFDVRQFSERTLQSTESLLSDYRGDNPDPIPLLYQTGYLTIKDSSDNDLFTLGFPNDEVRYAFLQSLMPEYVDECGPGTGKDIFVLKRYVEEGDTEGIHKVLLALFASITYSANEAPFEHYFQTVIHIVFTLLGKYVTCELHTSEGRIDCVVETKKYVYVFEFKRDSDADEALRQINDKHYADIYAADERVLYKIGVGFDSNTRQIDSWKVE